MLGFLLRRLLLAALLVFGVASASFVLMHLAPGDVVTESGPDLHPDQAQAERRALGLDRPLQTQYAEWIQRALRLDFGTSLKYRRPVSDLVGARALNTALLGATALLIATLVGLPLGVVTGSQRGGVLRTIVRGLSSLLVATPPLVATVALTAIAARNRWLPPPGAGISNLIVPALALALPIAGVLERLQSQAVREAMEERCVVAARARGVPQPALVWKHALRPSLGPVLAVYGIVAGSLLSGSFIVEIITDWPGLGLLIADGMRARDLYLVAGCAAVGATLLASTILVCDLLHIWLDPRLRE
jgi:ABC-type dipeptide/oligopeptide/nickel transport system permease component